ncbi:MAG: hypothetical protein IK008_06590 [Bacteroidales bacterium]|nr:hypothetical protein [Bacteroidales bacterium]
MTPEKSILGTVGSPYTAPETTVVNCHPAVMLCTSQGEGSTENYDETTIIWNAPAFPDQWIL